MSTFYHKVKNLKSYLEFALIEARKIAWPSKGDVIRALMMIVVMVSVVSLLFFVVDLSLIKLIQIFLDL